MEHEPRVPEVLDGLLEAPLQEVARRPLLVTPGLGAGRPGKLAEGLQRVLQKAKIHLGHLL